MTDLSSSCSLSPALLLLSLRLLLLSFFFNSTATTEIYTLSLHDALPIYSPRRSRSSSSIRRGSPTRRAGRHRSRERDRKSTRLNSSHLGISYAVFCLKKKKKIKKERKKTQKADTHTTNHTIIHCSIE